MTTDARKDFEAKARPLAQALLDYAMEEGIVFGITDAEVSVSGNENLDISIEKGDVTEVSAGRSGRVYVTLYAGDRVMSFSKNTLDGEDLKDAIRKNMEVIHLAPENPHKRLLEREKVFRGPLPDLDLYDAQQPDQKTLVEYARAVEAAALAEPGVKASRSTSVARHRGHFFHLATNGIDYAENTTYCQGGAYVIGEDANGMQIGGEYSTARHFSDMADPTALGRKAGQNAVSKLGAVLPDTGAMPIVLDNSAAAAFFSAVYSAIDGAAVHRGSTFLKGKLGQRVMSREVTLEDDPGIARATGSSRIDTAGMETEKVTFVKDGVLLSYNVTLMEARQLGIEPIGREDGSTNSRILPGSKTPEELMADIKEGIYIKGFNGGTVDVNNGTHSRQAYGLLIKDGKVTDTAVDGFVVSGNLKEMFMDVALANDTPTLPSTKHRMAAPTTRINKVTIAGK